MAKFGATKTAEQRLAIELRKVAKIVGGIVKTHVNGDKITDPKKLAAALAAYSDALGPWGEAVVAKIMAGVQDNNKHAEIMKKYPDMEHDDPNAKSVDPGKTAEILWRFSKTGTFEFACLIPGHREAGRHGTVAVK